MAKPAEQVSTEEVEMPEYVTTPDDVEKVIQAREQRMRTDQETYQKAYVSTMVSMGNGNEQHDDVVKEMMTNFNVRRTGNPQIDAELNYAKAQAAVLSRGATKTVPVKGEKPAAAGVTVGNTNTQRKVTLPKLSAALFGYTALQEFLHQPAALLLKTNRAGQKSALHHSLLSIFLRLCFGSGPQPQSSH